MKNLTIWFIGYRANAPEALETIKNADLVLVRGNLSARWLEEIGRKDFQSLSFIDDSNYEETLTQIEEAFRLNQLIVYVSPLTPVATDSVVQKITQKFADLQIRWVSGEDLTLNSLLTKNMQDSAGLVVLDGQSLNGKFHLPFSAAQTAVIYYPGEGTGLAHLYPLFNAVYPAGHKVYVLFEKASGKIEWNELEIEQIEQITTPVAAMILPPRASDSSLENFEEVIAHLRAPNGCPWDRKQTHQTLRTYLLEETYEALSALDANDMSGLAEELGDLILQIALHTQIAVESNEFNMADVLEGINRKIIRRHPHIFGDVEVEGEKGVVQNWEKLKQKERTENGEAESKGLLDGIPLSFPSLAQAQSIQDRAARVGFDWKEIQPVMDKVLEEYEEVQTAPDEKERAKELGDLLFAVVNLVRWYHVDAESALRETNIKFRRRFAYIERKSHEIDKPMQEMSLNEMDSYWDEAKKLEK